MTVFNGIVRRCGRGKTSKHIESDQPIVLSAPPNPGFPRIMRNGTNDHPAPALVVKNSGDLGTGVKVAMITGVDTLGLITRPHVVIERHNENTIVASYSEINVPASVEHNRRDPIGGQRLCVFTYQLD